MNKHIGFSHHYPKLCGQTSGKLLAVIPIKRKDMTDELIHYDTIYYENGKARAFPLPPGNYIQLVFIGNLGVPFCTIRSAWPKQKVEYYNSSIGEVFDIRFKGENILVKQPDEIMREDRRAEHSEEI